MQEKKTNSRSKSSSRDNALSQRNWSKEELEHFGFKYYERRKELIMARRLPKSESPLKIRTSSGDELTATAGDMICYEPGADVHHELSAYPHWPVEYDIFRRTYSHWDTSDWEPSASERFLLDRGCQPYFKSVGIWAKEVEQSFNMKSLEHDRPMHVDTGKIVAIGIDGEPYSMNPSSFRQRYSLPLRERIKTWIEQILDVLPLG